MEKVKAFLYLSLGLLALTCAYHLGVTSALGQGGNQVVTGELVSIDPMAVDQQGNIWLLDNGTTIGPIAPPVAGTIVAVDGCHSCTSRAPAYVVMYDDGSIYQFLDGTWSNVGNIFGEPTQAKVTTWGRVKAERR
jgi:hypothetical protein